jgi:hypothetical protein
LECQSEPYYLAVHLVLIDTCESVPCGLDCWIRTPLFWASLLGPHRQRQHAIGGDQTGWFWSHM